MSMYLQGVAINFPKKDGVQFKATVPGVDPNRIFPNTFRTEGYGAEYRGTVADLITLDVSSQLQKVREVDGVQYDGLTDEEIITYMKKTMSVADKRRVHRDRARYIETIGARYSSARAQHLRIGQEAGLDGRAGLDDRVVNVLHSAVLRAILSEPLSKENIDKLNALMASGGNTEGVILNFRDSKIVRDIIEELKKKEDIPLLEEVLQSIPSLFEVTLFSSFYRFLMTRRYVDDVFFALRTEKIISTRLLSIGGVFDLQTPAILAFAQILSRFARNKNMPINIYPVKLNAFGYGQPAEELEGFIPPQDEDPMMPGLQYYVTLDPANRGAFADSFRALVNLFFARGYTLMIAAPDGSQPGEVMAIFDLYNNIIMNPNNIFEMNYPLSGFQSVPVVNHGDNTYVDYVNYAYEISVQFIEAIYELGFLIPVDPEEFSDEYDNKIVPFWNPL